MFIRTLPTAKLGLFRNRLGSLRSHAADASAMRPMNALLALVDQGLVGCGNFAIIILVGRMAGSRQLGLFTLALTIYYLVLAVQESLITLPYTIYANKFPKNESRVFFSSVCWQQLAWSALATCGTAIAATAIFFAGDSELFWIAASFVFFVPLALFREFGRRHLFTEMRVKGVLRLTAANTTLLLAALAALAIGGGISAAAALAAMALGSAASGIVWLRLNGLPARYQFAPFRESCRRNWQVGRWLLASHATSLTANLTLPWVVAVYLGPAATGAFAACDAILRMANPLIVGLLNVLTPQAAISLEQGGRAELRRVVRAATIALGSIMAIFCVVAAIAGESILRLTFGPEFAIYGTTLLLLSVTHLIDKLSVASGRGLMVMEKPDAAVRGEAIGLAIGLASAIVLTPRFGIPGAASALLAGRLASSTVIVLAYRVLIADGNSPSSEGDADAVEACSQIRRA